MGSYHCRSTSFKSMCVFSKKRGGGSAEAEEEGEAAPGTCAVLAAVAGTVSGTATKEGGTRLAVVVIEAEKPASVRDVAAWSGIV